MFVRLFVCLSLMKILTMEKAVVVCGTTKHLLLIVQKLKSRGVNAKVKEMHLISILFCETWCKNEI